MKKRFFHKEFPGIEMIACDSQTKNGHLFGLGGDTDEVVVELVGGEHHGAEWHVNTSDLEPAVKILAIINVKDQAMPFNGIQTHAKAAEIFDEWRYCGVSGFFMSEKISDIPIVAGVHVVEGM